MVSDEVGFESFEFDDQEVIVDDGEFTFVDIEGGTHIGYAYMSRHLTEGDLG